MKENKMECYNTKNINYSLTQFSANNRENHKLCCNTSDMYAQLMH